MIAAAEQGGKMAIDHDPGVTTPNLAYAWAQQHIWSETANRLKHGLETARRTALVLGIAAAILAVDRKSVV